MSEISNQYNFREIENKRYQFWLDNHYFHSEPNSQKPYTIVIPPPNVTGILHMGHILNNTLQDILIRRARMNGFNACWVPGTDHASIATEAKVVQKLREEGLSKTEIGRESFLSHAWEWTHLHGGKILDQLKHLGCSCDWDRTRFTLDPQLSASVIQVFVELYRQGLIYRGYKMVNWDPVAQTNISEEEVNYVEKNGKLYYLKYKIVDSEDYLVVATTRPETIFGDNAVCVNPNDIRYQSLQGKSVVVPLVNRTVPVIFDDYVDPEFGTGCLKITPANDINDYEIGLKHQIPPIEIFNDDATLNKNAGKYQGKDRFEVRKEIAQELQQAGLMEKEEIYVNKVGTSERTGAVIEPKLSVQWFLTMKNLSGPALEVVMNDTVKFYPKKYKKVYKHWMENIHDWNISRQLWWGHQIPAYYYGSGADEFVVAPTADEALLLAQEKTGNPELKISNLQQDPDVLDTWFSSWLWPISVFNGILEPHNKDIEYYYPTHDLVTGPDIIFFWVARMIMAGEKFRKDIPFKNVYFTGIVRDNQGRKMSKQLGNSPDPIALMEKYSADGVRVGMMMSSSAGNDLLFDENLCLQGRNFTTKIWNGFRLVQSWKVEEKQPSITDQQAVDWFQQKYFECLQKVEDLFSTFRISDALTEVYKLVWDDYSSWFLELIKPQFGESISAITYHNVIEILENILKLLHPFIPFITEEIWQNITTRTKDEALIITPLPKPQSVDGRMLEQFSMAQEMVSAVRNFRAEKQLSPKEPLDLYVVNLKELSFSESIIKMAHINHLKLEDTQEPSQSLIIGNIEAKIPFTSGINKEEELAKLKEDLQYTRGFLQSVMNKLNNEKFVSGAPEKVVEAEKKKKADAEEKIQLIEKSIKELKDE